MFPPRSTKGMIFKDILVALLYAFPMNRLSGFKKSTKAPYCKSLIIWLIYNIPSLTFHMTALCVRNRLKYCTGDFMVLLKKNLDCPSPHSLKSARWQKLPLNFSYRMIVVKDWKWCNQAQVLLWKVQKNSAEGFWMNPASDATHTDVSISSLVSKRIMYFSEVQFMWIRSDHLQDSLKSSAV